METKPWYSKLWLWVSGLIVALFLFFVATANRSKPVTVSQDADNNGKNDQAEVKEIKLDMDEHRKAADTYVEAAQKALVQKPVVPSKSAAEAVRRLNEMDG